MSDRADPLPEEFPDLEPIVAVRERASEALRRGRGPSWVPLAIVVAILLIPGSGGSPFTAVALLGVLLLRDAGRWAGMQLLGASDRTLLLLPWPRTWLPDRGDGVEQWRDGVVILLGPLPGLLLAFALGIAWQVARLALLKELALVPAAVNAFTLLPLLPLDGGRLLNLLIFSRWRALELLFGLATALGMLGLAWLLESWILGIVGVAGLFVAHRRHQVSRAAQAIRDRCPGLCPRAGAADGAVLEALFDQAQRMVPPSVGERARRGDVRVAHWYADLMREMLDSAVLRPPSALPTAMLLSAYGFALVAGAAALVLVAAGR